MGCRAVGGLGAFDHVEGLIAIYEIDDLLFGNTGEDNRLAMFDELGAGNAPIRTQSDQDLHRLSGITNGRREVGVQDYMCDDIIAAKRGNRAPFQDGCAEAIGTRNQILYRDIL